ncbi:hypothetical protein JRQ81_003560 [Phrynocephalus forsythii]|uniref:Uncharacterized protein n=1 Tax=Phrynocephalus forsythii TaxID=171643 RepID=A0A9Q1AXT0_9SAUR|nr:hypothetical protein JRQ81_003560 [Phrynocephalus forsythii]
MESPRWIAPGNNIPIIAGLTGCGSTSPRKTRKSQSPFVSRSLVRSFKPSRTKRQGITARALFLSLFLSAARQAGVNTTGTAAKALGRSLGEAAQAKEGKQRNSRQRTKAGGRRRTGGGTVLLPQGRSDSSVGPDGLQ